MNPNGTLVTNRAAQLCMLVPSGSNYGYDLEVHIGIERFIKYRQREEIRDMLKEQYGISISTGEVSALAKRFLSHIEALHKERSGDLRAALSKDGGYPLHVDATTEDGKGTLLVIFSGWRQWVLGAWKIPSERAEIISTHILEISKTFGEPCAIMRDLGSPMARAAEDAANEMSHRPKILACHFHFLRDVGKDILGGDNENLRKLIRKLSVRDKIRVAVREIRKKIDPEFIDYIYTWFNSWLNECEYPSLPGGVWGISLASALGLWILDYSQDGQHLGFPFDCPCHNLYLRCKAAAKAIDYFLDELRFDNSVNKALERLKKAISPFLDNRDVRKTVRELEKRMALFDKLRNIFRLEGEIPDSLNPNSINSAPRVLDKGRGENYTVFESLEKNMQKQVQELSIKLKRVHENTRTAPDLKFAIKTILDHLDKHGKFLWGHLIELRTEHGSQYRLVYRTNNILECFFRKMKHGERRRSGRKILTRDFEDIPPSAALAMNLMDPDYVKIICGTLDDLPKCFSRIDQMRKDEVLNTATKNDFANLPYNYISLLSCSDKSFVRRESVYSWIIGASTNKPFNAMKNTVGKPIPAPFEDMDRFLHEVQC